MNAHALLADLRARGVELIPAGDRIRFRPASVVSPQEVEALRAHKVEVLALLSADAAVPAPEWARLLAMPLDVFASEGQPLEVRVPCWPASVFFVPDVRRAEALWREGVERERVWTAGELLALVAGPGLAPEALRVVMLARREFGGEVVAVLPRAGEKGTRES